MFWFGVVGFSVFTVWGGVLGFSVGFTNLVLSNCTVVLNRIHCQHHDLSVGHNTANVDGIDANVMMTTMMAIFRRQLLFTQLQSCLGFLIARLVP